MEVDREIERQEREMKEIGVGSEAKAKIKDMERQIDSLNQELQFVRNETNEKDDEVKQLLEQITELKEFRLEQQKDNKTIELSL